MRRRPVRRHQRKLDPGRIREASRGPGADPRTWVNLARVDDDPDAIRWDDTLGWLVDVTCLGGSLDGEGPIVCRVALSFAQPDGARVEPVDRGALVVLVFPGGDPNEEPTILGQLHTNGRTPPSGLTVEILQDNHYLKTPHGVLWGAGKDIAITSDQLIRLGATTASQSLVLGDRQRDALHGVLDALGTFCAAVEGVMTAVPFAKPGLSAPLATLQTAIASAKDALTAALSDKVKGA